MTQSQCHAGLGLTRIRWMRGMFPPKPACLSGDLDPSAERRGAERKQHGRRLFQPDMNRLNVIVNWLNVSELAIVL